MRKNMCSKHINANTHVTSDAKLITSQIWMIDHDRLSVEIIGLRNNDRLVNFRIEINMLEAIHIM